MMFAKYFEYYIIILRGAVFSWSCCSCVYAFSCICVHCVEYDVPACQFQWIDMIVDSNE